MQSDAQPPHIKKLVIVSKGAMKSFNKMLPLVRMFPLAVMHTHSLPLFNTILVKKKPEVRRGLDIKN